MRLQQENMIISSKLMSVSLVSIICIIFCCFCLLCFCVFFSRKKTRLLRFFWFTFFVFLSWKKFIIFVFQFEQIGGRVEIARIAEWTWSTMTLNNFIKINVLRVINLHWRKWLSDSAESMLISIYIVIIGVFH